MFLKFLDDLEIQREEESKLAGKEFKPAAEPPYRWRDWATRADGITADGLLAFINNEEAALPDGKRGAGLFRYLRTLTNCKENDHVWKVPAAELLENNCNLDRKNPRAKEDITHLPPEQLAESILEKERRIAEIMGSIKGLLAQTK